MSSNVVEFDYMKMDDAELIKLLRQRKLPIPTREGGFVDKLDAAKELKRYDENKRQNEERVWVTFHRSSHPNSGPYVFASVNEKTMIAPYDEKVCIPRYFLTECIDRAIITTFDQEETARGFKLTQSKIPTYPYTLHGVATDDEVYAALAKAKKRGRPKKQGVADSES